MEVLGKLGIDLNSVVLYLINFGILFAVIAYYVTGPVLRMLDERKKMIKNNLEEAEKIKREFMEEKIKADHERELIKADMSSQMDQLKKSLEERRKKQEGELLEKKTKMMEEIRVLVEDEKNKVLKKAEAETLNLITKIVMNIVSNKIPQEVVKESVTDSWKVYNK